MEMNRYRNFILRVGRISPKTRRYRVEVYGLVPGRQPGSNEFERQAYNRGIFVVASDGETVDLLERLARRRISTSQLHQLGTILSDLLLPGSIRDRFRDSLDTVRERKQRLRLRLMIEAPELIPLPWEYLYLQ